VSSIKTIALVFAVIILDLIILMSPNIAFADNSALYSRPIITLACGPRDNSDLSIVVNAKGFKPNQFLDYRILAPYSQVVAGGFSTGSSGQNNVTINIGPHSSKILLNFFQDMNSNHIAETTELLHSSNLVVPCSTKHFAVEYYRTHYGAVHDLFGIKALNNHIRLGNYVLNTFQDAMRILDGSTYHNSQDHFAAELLAATMNVLSGGRDDCISSTISVANDILKDQNYQAVGKENIQIKTNNEAETQMLSLTSLLKGYNENGCLSSSKIL
jgi:hypothetical protein